MSAKERIISIRLIEMIHGSPEYAGDIGIKGEMINLENINMAKADDEKSLGLAANKRIVMSEEED